MRDIQCLQRTVPRTTAPHTTNHDQVHHSPTASRHSMSRPRHEPSCSASSIPKVSVQTRLAKGIIRTGQRQSRDPPPFQRSQILDPTLTRWSMPAFCSTQHHPFPYHIHLRPSSRTSNPRQRTDSMTVAPSSLT